MSDDRYWVEDENFQGYLFEIEQWKESVEMGLFNEYDGKGYFLDKEHNRIEGNVFDLRNIPVDAKYVEWFSS